MVKSSGARSMHGVGAYIFVGKHKRRYYLGDQGIDGRTTLQLILEKQDERMDYIELDQNGEEEMYVAL